MGSSHLWQANATRSRLAGLRCAADLVSGGGAGGEVPWPEPVASGEEPESICDIDNDLSQMQGFR